MKQYHRTPWIFEVNKVNKTKKPLLLKYEKVILIRTIF